MTDVEKSNINVTLGNGQKMKFEIKGSVTMKLQYGQAVKLTEILYAPQDLEKLLSVSRLILKGAAMGSTQDKMIIKKNRVSMTLDARKGQNMSIMFYLKSKRYAPKVQEALTNLKEKKIETRDKK